MTICGEKWCKGCKVENKVCSDIYAVRLCRELDIQITDYIKTLLKVNPDEVEL